MMPGFLYLLITVLLGRQVCWRAIDPDRWIRQGFPAGEPGRRPHSAPLHVALWIVTGMLLMGWGTYAIACLTRSTHAGVGGGLFAASLAILVLECREIRAAGAGLGAGRWSLRRLARQAWEGARGIPRIEGLTLALIVASSAALMLGTLSGDRESIFAGPTISSDFFAHISVIRSFSEGANYPTEYPMHPAGSIRYHFLFQFYCAALETLGLPLAWAVNIPSIAALCCLLILLSTWAACLTGSRAAGFFAVLLALLPPLSPGNLLLHFDSPAPWREMWESRAFVGWTFQEPWGLWSSLNIFANQRHLALGVSVLLIALLATLPAVRAFQRAVRGAEWWQLTSRTIYRRDCWLPTREGLDLRTSTFLGLLLGLTGFWNGSCLIAALLVLAWTGLFAHQRLGFAIIALLAVALAGLQSRFFIPDGGALQFAFRPGFLARSPAWRDVGLYYLQVLGLAIPAALIGTLAMRKATGACMLAPGWLLPTVLASLFAITVDVTANHKFVLVSYLLFTPPIAWLLVQGCRHRPLAASVGLLLLVLPGVSLARVLINSAGARVDMTPPSGKPLRDWVKAHVGPKDVTLTANDSINEFLVSGREIYNGWHYYAWSAGYDTRGRQEKMLAIYGAATSADVVEKAREEHIRFIVLDDTVKQTLRPNLPAFQHTPGVLEEVWKAPDKTIYEVK